MINNIYSLISNTYSIQQTRNLYYLFEKQEPTFPKTVVKTTGKTQLYKFDEDTDKLLPFFKNVKGAKSIADYVFFQESNNQLYVFIFELSTKKHKTHQFEPTKLFVEYILNTYKRIYGTNLIVNFRNVIIRKNYQPKKTTKPSLPFKNGEPEIIKAGSEIMITNYCS